MKPVEIYFCHDYYARKLNIHTCRDDWWNPVRRTEVDREIRRALYDRFGYLGLGEQNPAPRPELTAFGHRFLAAAAGGVMHYMPDQEPAALVTENAYDKMVHFDLDGLESSDVVRKMLSDAKILKEKYGYVSGEFNMGSALNTATAVFGDEFFYACSDEPDLATKVLTDMNRMTVKLYELVCHAVEPEKYPVPMRYAFYGNCPAIMISPAMYEEVVLPADMWLRSKVDTFMLHHCGIVDNYLELYKQLKPSILDLGGGCDYLRMRRAFPDTPCWLNLTTKDVENVNTRQIRSLVRKVYREGGPEDKILKIYVSDLSGDTQDRVVEDIATAHLYVNKEE